MSQTISCTLGLYEVYLIANKPNGKCTDVKLQTDIQPIPHTINYCWFGGSPLGKKELACIESWKRYLPGYEIRRWDETNFDFRCCDYVSEAYDAKKWAFVSDYARFEILYEHGGLYFDTDVELIKPIDDILERGPFMGFETDWVNDADGAVAPGLGLAANPGLGLYNAILASYKNNHFVKPDGTLDETTIVTRATRVLLQHGLESRAGIQEVEGVWLYPSEYFNPKDFKTGKIHITDNTRSIHHFSMSWLTPEQIFQNRIINHLTARGMSEATAGHISGFLTTLRYLDFGRVVKHFKWSKNG